MVIVCFASVGASLASGSAAALTLVTATLCVQLFVFLWITCLCPSIDRIENIIAALGWGVESCSMLLLVLASFFPSLQTGSLETAAYALSLLGGCLPLLKLSYEGLLAPLGSCFLRHMDGEARMNPCSMGTLLWFLRLLLALGHKLAANCCTGGLGGETTGTAARTDVTNSGVVCGGRDDGNPFGLSHMADSGFVYGGRDDGNPFGLSHMADSGVIYAYGGRDDRVTQRRAAPEEAEEAFGRNDDGATSARMTTAEATRVTPSVAPSVAPSAAPGAAPGSAPAADRAAGMDAAHGAGSLPAAGETRSRRTLASSARAQTEPASVAAPAAALGAAAAASASASAAAAALRPQREIGRPRKLRLTPPHPGTAWTHARGICHGLNAIQHPWGVDMGWESPAEGEPAAAAAASAVFGRPSEGLSAELASELSDLSA